MKEKCLYEQNTSSYSHENVNFSYVILGKYYESNI